MSRYETLAHFYDSLTGDVRYEDFLDYYEKVFGRYGVKPRLVLDLACGTGTLTGLMAERVYEMVGVDASADMLIMAREKSDSLDCKIEPVFINQPLEELDMYGGADAAVCCLDGINYVEPDSVAEVFRRLSYFIEPGGVLVFDINSPYKLRRLDGEMFIDETDDVYCVWRADFDEEENACFYGMDIFSRLQNDLWDRQFEEHVEYAYSPEWLKNLLEEAGFTDVGIFGNMNFLPPEETEERIFITARNKEIKAV